MTSSHNADSSRFSRSEWVLLCLMAAIQFSHIVDFMIMMPLGPQLMRLFQIDPQQFGLLVSSYTFAAGISGFAASFFIDRYDRKSSLLFFYIGFAVGTIACALAPTFSLLLLCRSLTGFFGGVLGSLVLSIVSDAIPYNRRGAAMGIVMGSFSIASVFGVPFSLYLANLTSWHAPFMFLGVVSFIVIGLVVSFMQPMKKHLRSKSERHPPLAAITHIFKTKNQLFALLFMFCLILGQFSIIPLLSASYVSNAGLTEAQLPLTYMFGGLCTIVASPLVGRLADRFGKRKIFLIAVATSILPIYVITNLGQNPLWFVLFISSCFFVMMSGRMVPAMAMISATATPAYRGSFMSISSSVQQLSAALASYLSGVIVVQSTTGELLRYEYVGYIAIGFSCLAFLVAFKVHGEEKGAQSSHVEVL